MAINPISLTFAIREKLQEEKNALENLKWKIKILASKQMNTISNEQGNQEARHSEDILPQGGAKRRKSPMPRQSSIQTALNEKLDAEQEVAKIKDVLNVYLFMYLYWMNGNPVQLAEATSPSEDKKPSLIDRFTNIQKEIQEKGEQETSRC